MATRSYKPGAGDIKPDIVAAQKKPLYEAGDTNPQDAGALGYNDQQAAPSYYELQKKDVKLALEANNLKKFHQAMFTLGYDHRAPRDIIWQQCWDIYNNKFDWSQKAWWQHKAPIPKVRVSVDRAAALFRKTLLKMNPFYGLKAESKLGRMKGRYTMLIDDYHFDKANVIEELVMAFKVGLITSTAATKIFWARERDVRPKIYTDVTNVDDYEFGLQVGSHTESKKRVEVEEYYRGALGFKCVNPSLLWVIPGTRSRGFIERTQITLNELQANMRTSANPEGIYEEDAVMTLTEKILSSQTSSGYNPDHTDQTNEGQISSSAYLRMITLEHFWGDIYDDMGRLALCDGSYTFAGCGDGNQSIAEVLVRKPRPNPFYHKMPPYVVGSPYIIPFSTYNRGMVEDVMEIAKSIIEMANLIADGALYDALKAFAIDADQLDSPEEAKSGMYPGKTFIYKSGQSPNPNQQVVQTINVGKIPQEANNMIGLFEKYFQEGSFVNEWVAGTGSKTDRTLGEVNIKTQSALEGLDESARNLETTLIEPSLEMATKVIYQFHTNYLMPRLVENYPQISMLLQDLSAAERYMTMVGDFSFEVRGLSIMIDRAQRIGEFKEILQLLSYLPGFLERLNPDAVLEEILAPVGWDPNKILLNAAAGPGLIPIPGQLPSSPVSLPIAGGGAPAAGGGSSTQPPMQRRNAAEGARLGGATNNPVGGQQSQMGGGMGAGAMMNPEVLRQMILQRLTFPGNRPGLGRGVI